MRTRAKKVGNEYVINGEKMWITSGTIADVVGVNPPYVKTFQGGLLGTVGGTTIAPGVPNSAIDATVAANQTLSSGFASGQLSCASAQANPAT